MTFKVDRETASAGSALSDTHRSRKGTRAADTSPLVSHADVGQESTERQKREREEDHVPLESRQLLPLLRERRRRRLLTESHTTGNSPSAANPERTAGSSPGRVSAPGEVRSRQGWTSRRTGSAETPAPGALAPASGRRRDLASAQACGGDALQPETAGNSPAPAQAGLPPRRPLAQPSARATARRPHPAELGPQRPLQAGSTAPWARDPGTPAGTLTLQHERRRQLLLPS